MGIFTNSVYITNTNTKWEIINWYNKNNINIRLTKYNVTDTSSNKYAHTYYCCKFETPDNLLHFMLAWNGNENIYEYIKDWIKLY